MCGVCDGRSSTRSAFRISPLHNDAKREKVSEMMHWGKAGRGTAPRRHLTCEFMFSPEGLVLADNGDRAAPLVDELLGPARATIGSFQR
jgi:hypothetical protein